MTLFVDASAFISIIASEPDRDTLARRVIADEDPIWSAMSYWETISGLRHSHKYPLLAARDEVEKYAQARPLRLVAIGDAERLVSLDAYDRYGKGSGHAAALNMGDCFAYACAKTNNARLLYKGGDFKHTDLA